VEEGRKKESQKGRKRAFRATEHNNLQLNTLGSAARYHNYPKMDLTNEFEHTFKVNLFFFSKNKTLMPYTMF
jgi:hypothetical protein